MSNDAKARDFFQQLTLSELPIGIYLASPEGRLLECNVCCRKMLALPPEGPLNCNLAEFHFTPPERNKLWEQAREAEAQGRYIDHVLVALSVKGGDLFVRESIRVLHDQQGKQVIGYIGYICDVTKEYRYHKLFDHLPVGIYRVDVHDRVMNVNEALVQILGYGSKDELYNRHVREFYTYPEEAAALSEMVKNKGGVAKEIRELIKKNGELIFASISSVAIIGVDGSYDGREGTLVDVTKEERYRRSLQDVPVGFYEVRKVNGQDIIQHCNQMFAKLHDFDTENEVIGRDISQFHVSIEDYHCFLEALKAKDAEGLPLLGYHARAKTRKGQRRLFEVDSRPLKDRSQKIFGRMGVVRDISKEERLREEMRHLQSDIGRVLHAYTTALLTTRHAITATITSLGPEPFPRHTTPSMEEIDLWLVTPAGHLATSLHRWIMIVESNWQQRGILPKDWEDLSDVLRQLHNYRDTIQFAEIRPHTLRCLARKIIEIFNRLPKRHLPKEQGKRILYDASELDRQVCIINLRQVETELMAMDHQVRAFREHVTTSARLEEAPRVIRFWDLIKQAMKNLDEYAQSEGVEFRPKDDSEGGYVSVGERDMLRAVSNLLHNAIKYSWRREGKPPWVTIHAYANTEYVCATFENYGVPIPEDEIKQKLIFEFGYRGRFSSDRGRLGTGIGLTDALYTARHYGGNVVVESTSAWRDAPSNYYKTPYLTRVTLSLPIYLPNGGL